MKYPKKLSIHIQTSMSRGGISFLSLQDENGHTRGDMGPNEQPYIAIADQIVKSYNLFPATTALLIASAEALMENGDFDFPEAEEIFTKSKQYLKTLKEPISYE